MNIYKKDKYLTNSYKLLKKINNNIENNRIHVENKIKDNKLLKCIIKDYDLIKNENENENENLLKSLNLIKKHINSLLLQDNKLNKLNLIKDDKIIDKIIGKYT